MKNEQKFPVLPAGQFDILQQEIDFVALEERLEMAGTPPAEPTDDVVRCCIILEWD